MRRSAACYVRRVTPDDFRRLALALPETVEGEHHGHPDFRAHGRVFASLHPDGVRAMVKVPPAVQQRLVAQHANVCAPANGAWGRAGCTMVTLALAHATLLQDALQEAWQFAGLGPGTKSSARAIPAKASKRRPAR
jgi:hypothetical protein